MPYLLDSNACIFVLRRADSLVAAQMATVPREQIILCDIVKAELYYGSQRSARPEHNLMQLEAFFANFVSLPFDGQAALLYGRIRRQLEVAGTPIGPHDLLIASITLTNGLTLETHNTREFSRVPDLIIADWEL